MDVGAPLEGGGNAKTRRRRRRTRAAREDEQVGGGSDVSVEKAPEGETPPPVPVQAGGAVKPKATPVKAGVPKVSAPAPTPTPAAAAPKIVIAPPKKKPAKLLLVPRSKTVLPARIAAAKTFKARRVSVTIDNTAKTQKRRTQTLQRVEGMTEDQLRAAAVAAKLSRRETVAKVPADLLRQMLKDYYMMRGTLV